MQKPARAGTSKRIKKLNFIAALRGAALSLINSIAYKRDFNMTLLRLGDRGDAVAVLQKLLVDKNYKVSIDKIFGKNTELAVKKFQTDNKLYPDGIVGRKTWEALGKRIVQPVPPPPIKGVQGRQFVIGMKLSESGIQALYKLESLRGVSNHLHWPGGKSGVTLGAGYDMLERTQSEIKEKLISIGIDANSAAKAAEGAAKSHKAASDFAVQNKDLINLTKQQEIELLRLTVPHYETLIKNRITIPLTQYEFDALVSFAYNSGGVLNKVTNDINKGNVGDAMTTIKKIIYSGGKVFKGLVNRRNSEVKLYLEGIYDL
ncbi:peptidoglycan-binding protein [Pantoea sp. CS_6]|uniref:glycoside hydrolase family protein n=1 Tax=Pantoea TaxID=53335 RepID=UPI00209D221E|nr:peptidoglycan-binding protein [Pantoea stewartii]